MSQDQAKSLIIEEIPKGEHTGIISPMSTVLIASDSLSNLVSYFLKNVGYYVDKNDICLRNNPYLKIKYFNKHVTSLKEKSEFIISNLKRMYSIRLEEEVKFLDHIEILSDDNPPIMSKVEEQTFSSGSDMVHVKNMSLSEIIIYLRTTYNVKIQLNENLVCREFMVKRPNLYSMNIPIKILGSKEVCRLSDYFEKRNFTNRIIYDSYIQVSVLN